MRTEVLTIKGTNIYKDLAVIIDNASHERIIGVINQGITIRQLNSVAWNY